jgi:hypothetical protein
MAVKQARTMPTVRRIVALVRLATATVVAVSMLAAPIANPVVPTSIMNVVAVVQPFVKPSPAK